MRVHRWLLWCMLVPTSGALAQRVHGVVRDTLSRGAVAGAVVSVLDAGGRSLGRDLTNSVGAYSLSLPDGAARLRVVRIGFRPREVALPAVTGEVEIDVALEPLPSLLEKVTVSEAKECPRREDHDRALGLWEQARAALLASIAARETRPGDMIMLEYRRLVDRADSTTVWQQVRSDSARTSRPFVPIRPAAAFARDGYMIRGPQGRELGAPDADILLDDSFAATHCFSIAAPDVSRRGQLGLAFAPAPGRDRLVDVRGVLWIDRIHPALRTLEFVYTGLSRGETEAGSGGRVSFRTMPNGVVFIDAWSILSAQQSSQEIERVGFMATRRLARAKTSGGVVTFARWDDGTHWQTPTASVHGEVTVAPGVRRSGLRVWLVGTTDTTTTDSLGRFRFSGLLGGTYAVDAAEPVLASAGIRQNAPADSAVATVADTATAVVHLESPVQAARAVCHDGSGPMPDGILLVRVVDADGWYVPRDRVEATWKKPSTRILGISIGHTGRSGGLTDDDGRVAVCNPPRREPVSIAVGPPGLPQASTTVTVPAANPLALVTVRLPGPGSH